MSFNFMAAVTICSDFGVPKIKSAAVSTVSPSISHEMMGPDAMVLVLEGLVGLHGTIQLQLLQHYWLGYRLGLL